MKETKKIFALTVVVGMVITIVIADLIVDALTPMKSLAFTYRLIVNVCTVIIFALIYFMVSTHTFFDSGKLREPVRARRALLTQ
jgi:prolipoprotein diacylglyceryltransferase